MMTTSNEHNNAPAVPQGMRLVPVWLLERVEQSLGSFTSDEGWSQSDMDTMDSVSAMLAAAPAPAPAQEPDDGDITGTYGLLPEHGWDEVPKDLPIKPRMQINVRIDVPPDWANRGDMQTIVEREVKAERWAWFHVESTSTEPAQEQCNACLGTGRMVRDPDIGTDQECFVCDGAGYEPAQEVGLTDDEINSIWSDGHPGSILSPWGLNKIRAIIAALRAKGVV